VTAENGACWGCFGRELADAPDARIIIRGTACFEWVDEIAGPPSETLVAGLQYPFGGACQNAANRLLLPAGIDVSCAPGNEIATCLYGKYGLGVQEYTQLVKVAASRANSRTGGEVSDEMLQEAILRVTHDRDDEISILREDLREILKVKNVALSPQAAEQFIEAYSRLYARRQAIYEQYKSGKINGEGCISELKTNVAETVHDVESAIGKEMFLTMFSMPADVAQMHGIG